MRNDIYERNTYLRTENRKLRKELKESKTWHDAVLHECMMTEACYKEEDPLGSIQRLIDWHLDNTKFHIHNTNQNLLLRIDELESRNVKTN